ncbi:hypothetical protein DEMA109039_14865 [Deinococcus marmoris]
MLPNRPGAELPPLFGTLLSLEATKIRGLEVYEPNSLLVSGVHGVE